MVTTQGGVIAAFVDGEAAVSRDRKVKTGGGVLWVRGRMVALWEGGKIACMGGLDSYATVRVRAAVDLARRWRRSSP
jgi:hypothetical protein